MADDPVLSGIKGGFRGALPYLVGVLLALALILHAVFPRYEWRVVGERGEVIVVYDRWSGQYQRAEYQSNGEVVPNNVFVPF
jgi:hypothetical protein